MKTPSLTPIAVALGYLATAGLLAVHRVGGFADTRLRPETVDGEFARLNVRLYSPLCLLLALGTALAARG